MAVSFKLVVLCLGRPVLFSDHMCFHTPELCERPCIGQVRLRRPGRRQRGGFLSGCGGEPFDFGLLEIS